MATPSGLVSLVRLTTWGGELVLALLLKATNRLEIEAKPFRKGKPMRSVALEKGSCCNQAQDVQASPIRYGGDDLLDENPIRSERVILWCEFHSFERG